MPVVVPLVALDVLVVVLWAIALALGIALVMDKLSAILAGVPWVGGKLSDAVKSMARAIANAAGTLEGGIDHLIGAAWHALSRYLDKLFSEFVAHSSVILHMAEVVGSHIYSVSGLRSFVKSLAYVAHAALKLADALEKKYHGIEHRVRTLEREIARGIGNDVRIHVRALENKFGRLTHRTIPNLRKRIQAAEGEVTQLQDFIKATPGTRYLDWVKGLALAGLAALGLGGLNCDSNPFKNNSNACGLWNDLADLLGLATIAIEAADFEQLVREAQSLEQDVTKAIQSLWNI